MSLSPEFQPPDTVSKVTFSPVTDGKTDALIVTIKTVVPDGDEINKIMEEIPKRRSSSDTKRKTRPTRSSTIKADQPVSKSTMTERPEGVSFASQTSIETATVVTPAETATPLPGASDSSPCIKHAALNISRKASEIPSEKISLCNNCSKSMLSYIFLVQDFLESLATEICGNEDSKKCVQCLRQELRDSLSSSRDETPINTRSMEGRSPQSQTTKDSHRSGSSRASKKSTSSKETYQRDVRKNEESSKIHKQRSLSLQQEHTHPQSQPNYPHVTPHPSLLQHEGNKEHSEAQNFSQHQNEHLQNGSSNEWRGSDRSHTSQSFGNDNQSEVHVSHAHRSQPPASYHEMPPSMYQGSQQPIPQQEFVFRKPMGRQQPDFTDNSLYQEQKGGERPDQSNFRHTVSSPLSEAVDGIVTTLSNVERHVYDAARNGAGWESLGESQERHMSSISNEIPSEAFVTMCRNNAEALGCLVVGTSLLLTRTSRTLCVLVSDGVSNAFRGPLSSVFHVVQCVRAMDSLGTTKLALLEQPELGISFEKLNVWRLVQFNKCVFLNPDTLVLQNCDELFCHDELSAVPDIGWPDCFNSGTFVFVPSIQTFWKLLEFAERQGSYDGGDQGLLNSYFNNWSDDINKKLSFIYNLMANVSYTYTPAFKQFGRNVKIVQFYGSFKPWHVKFFSRTGQISPASTVHPTYLQFVHIWINIFRISALRQLSQEIQSYALSQEVICAVELLRFFPLPSESEADFYLTPPSVRLRLAERKLQKIMKPTSEAQRRKSAEFPRGSTRDEDKPSEEQVQDVTANNPSAISDICRISEEAGFKSTSVLLSEGGSEETECTDSVTDKNKKIDENILPGAEVGNYQGMKAWEQGRMDYQGAESSDNILKRLQFLMDQTKQ